jgi:hypothetical protein
VSASQFTREWLVLLNHHSRYVGPLRLANDRFAMSLWTFLGCAAIGDFDSSGSMDHPNRPCDGLSQASKALEQGGTLQPRGPRNGSIR